MSFIIIMSANCTMIISICTRQRAPSSMYKSANAIMARRSTLLRGGVEAHFFTARPHCSQCRALY